MEIINNLAIIFNNAIISLYNNNIEYWQIIIGLIILNFVIYILAFFIKNFE